MTTPSTPKYPPDSPRSSSPLLPSHLSKSSSPPPPAPPPAHSAYHLQSDTDTDYDDDKEIDTTIAFFEQRRSLASPFSSAANSPQGTPRLSSVAKGISRGVSQRNFSRRALLLALLGTAIAAAVVTGARRTEGGEGWIRKVGGLKQASSRWKDKAVDGFTRLVYSSAELGDPMYEGPWETLDTSQILKFPGPAETMREQLMDGVRYVTAMSYGGHANQHIGIQKLLYYAKLTNRVGIIPTLIPVHIDGDPVPMSSFYDLDRFWTESRVPAVEMTRLKELDLPQANPHNERLSCWSVQELTAGHANLNGAWSFDLHDIWIDAWPLPPLARGLGGFDVAFDALRLFDFDPWFRNGWVQKVRQEFLPQNPPADPEKPFDGDLSTNLKLGFDTQNTNPPDDQITCFDNTLFLGPVMFPELPINQAPLEDTVAGEGLSWMNIGQHLRFNDAVESKADEYLMSLFDVKTPAKIPPFITIHLRRGDFKDFTGFTALDKYVSALGRVREALQKRLDHPDSYVGPGRRHFKNLGLKASQYQVVATTDESGESDFVKEVRALGWKVLDHEGFGTKEKLGGWWPTMLDGAILARGRSFVGTDRSTFSHLAGLRVKYWRGGLVEAAV